LVQHVAVVHLEENVAQAMNEDDHHHENGNDDQDHEVNKYS
jgi:hypothetical protein